MVFSPALTDLANQAPKLLPQAERPQIVDGCENEECQDEREAPAKRPVLRLRTNRATPNGLDCVEEEMSTIQYRDWQEVDESEIN